MSRVAILRGRGGPRCQPRPSPAGPTRGRLSLRAGGTAFCIIASTYGGEGVIEHRPVPTSRRRGRLRTKTRIPPVNATRANGGTRGRERRHLPDRGQAATSRRRAKGHNVCERDTGERRAKGRERAGSVPLWPSPATSRPRGYVTHVVSPGPTGTGKRGARRRAITHRIAADHQTVWRPVLHSCTPTHIG